MIIYLLTKWIQYFMFKLHVTTSFFLPFLSILNVKTYANQIKYIDCLILV